MATIQKVVPQKLRSAYPPDRLADEESPRCQNVRFRFGEVLSAPGRSLLAAAPNSQAVLGLFRFPVSDGTEWVAKLTESKLYRWGGGSPGTPRAWSEVTGSGILSSTRRWSAVAAEDRFFFCRGNEPIHRWPASTDLPGAGTHEAIPASAGTVPAARLLAYYNDRLIALDTVESVVRRANRLRWPVNGNHTDWAGTGSGFLDLFDEREEPILGAATLGDRLVIYRQHSIMDLIRTGLTLPVFTTEGRLTGGRGLGAPFTLASTGQVHFFLANDLRVYGWDGTALSYIGAPIERELASTINRAQMDSYFATVWTEEHEYRLVIGEHVFIYDYARDAWTREECAALSALAEVEDAETVTTWSTITGTWAQQGQRWEELAAEQITALWGGRLDGQTLVITDATTADAFAGDLSMDRFVETPDFYFGGSEALVTLTRILLLYTFRNADPWEIDVSTDHGQTWSPFPVIPSVKGYSFIDCNLTGPSVRLRLAASGPYQQVQWRSYVPFYEPAGPRQP